MKKLALLLPLIFVMVTSGCTIPGTSIDIPGIPSLFGPTVNEYEHDVLIIKNIQAIPSTLSQGQQFRLIADVENRGNKPIDAEVRLYDWCSSIFTLLQSSNGRDVFTDTKSDLSVVKLKNILPTEIREVYWSLKASPKIALQTVCPQDGMKVYVKYSYTTESTTTLEIINEDELQKLLEEGKFTPSQSSISVGYGPIKPYITVEDQQPISQASGSTVLGFQIENRGNGFLSDYVIKPESITIELPWYLKIKDTNECTLKEVIPFSKGMQMMQYRPTDEVRLIKGKSPKLLCEFELPKKGDADASTAQQRYYNIPKIMTAHMRAELKEYSYEFRSAVSVVVSPKF